MKSNFLNAALALTAASLLLGAGTSALAQAAVAGCSDDVPQAATRGNAEFQSNSRAVRGLLYKPLGTPNGAAVVLLHGKTGLQGDAQRFDPHAIQLAARGYHVLVPNYYDARAGQERPSFRDIRQWEETAQDAVVFLGTQPGVDPLRVAVWGYSLGGFIAADGAAHPDSTARAAIGVAAGTDIFEPSRSRREVPMLLIHGNRDPKVSAASMRDFAADLRRRGGTVEVHMLDTDQHVMDGPIWCEVFQQTRRFLDTTLLPAPAATAAAQ